MFYEEFSEKIINELNERLKKSDYEVTCENVSVNKNNGVELNGIRFNLKDSNVAPVMYIDDFFDMHENEELSLDEIINKIEKEFYSAIKSSYTEKIVNENKEILSKDYILDNVLPVVINYDSNIDSLKSNDYLYEDMGELAVTYRVFIDYGNNDAGSYLLKQGFLDKLNISMEEIQKNAISNLNSNVEINTMSNIFPYIPEDAPEIYILSNKKGVYGANALLDKNTLDKMCDLENVEELTIIPSSIHEVLVQESISAKNEEQNIFINNMISDVNETEVDTNDRLSDYPFVYDKNHAEIYCVNSNNEKTFCISFDDDVMYMPSLNNGLNKQK